MDMKIDYQIISIDDIMQYFAKDFNFLKGRKLYRAEYFIDVKKGKVVFELTSCNEELK